MNAFDWLNGVIAAATVTFRAAVALGAAWGFFKVAMAVRWAVGTTILTGILAAFVIWLAAFGGLEFFSGLMGNTAQTTR